ncbi:hypothetical protein [Novipirellula maiorica]|nr:hypothetical protein [Rhodopirellula maiorica]
MKRILLLATMAFSTAVLGCGENTEPASTATTTTAEPASEATLVALQKADMLDGSEDHVIGKCYVCKLGMDGSDQITAEVHGYTAHLCSESCREHFEASPDEVIASTKIPE